MKAESTAAMALVLRHPYHNVLEWIRKMLSLSVIAVFKIVLWASCLHLIISFMLFNFL